MKYLEKGIDFNEALYIFKMIFKFKRHRYEDKTNNDITSDEYYNMNNDITQFVLNGFFMKLFIQAHAVIKYDKLNKDKHVTNY